jgi:outer membrane beta-barrel protein
MESRIQGNFLIMASLLLAFGCQSLRAEEAVQVIDPQIDRRVISESEIDSENFEAGIFFGALSIEDFGVNEVFGLRVAYHVNENIFLETVYGQSQGEESSAELIDYITLLTDEERDYSYYNFSVGYNVLPGEAFVAERWAFNSALYLIAGVGSTDFAGDDRFTVNVGLGYRLVLTDWATVHLDFRDHIFDIDIFGEEKTAHNLEFHTGVTFFF